MSCRTFRKDCDHVWIEQTVEETDGGGIGGGQPNVVRSTRIFCQACGIDALEVVVKVHHETLAISHVEFLRIDNAVMVGKEFWPWRR